MEDIKEMMQAAHMDYLQEEWHKFIVYMWKNCPDFHMGRADSLFTHRTKSTFDDFYKLRNVPQFKHQKICTIRRYVAAYMPLISGMLWDEKDEETVLLVMRHNNGIYNVRPVDNKQRDKERRDYVKSAKKASAERASARLVANQRQANSRSNWGACK